MTCYRELGISLCDVFRMTRLPIVGEIYDDCFPTMSLLWIKDPVSPYGSCSKFGDAYSLGNLVTKFTRWVKEFVRGRPEVSLCKNLASSLEDFEDWQYIADPILISGFIWLSFWVVGLVEGFCRCFHIRITRDLSNSCRDGLRQIGRI